MIEKENWCPANLDVSDLMIIKRIAETIVNRFYDRYWFHEHWGLDKIDIQRSLDMWPCKPEDAWIIFACLSSIYEDNEFDKVWKPILGINKNDFDTIFKRFESC